MQAKTEASYSLLGGRTALGLALYPDRITAVLLTHKGVLLQVQSPCPGSSLHTLPQAIPEVYRTLSRQCRQQFGVGILRLDAIGIADQTGQIAPSPGGWLHGRLAGRCTTGPTLAAEPNAARIASGAWSGVLSSEGARFLDPDGPLRPGAVLCPPEGAPASLLPPRLRRTGLDPAVIMAATARYTKCHPPGMPLPRYLNGYFNELQKEEKHAKVRSKQ